MPIPERLRPPTPTEQEMRAFMELCSDIENAPAYDVEPLLARWHERAQRTYTHAEFKCYYGAVDTETFVSEMLLGLPAFVPDVTHAEALEVMRAVRAAELSEDVNSYFLQWLDVNLPNCDMTDLIYYSHHWFGDESFLHAALSDEQVLAYAMARSGRQLPGAPADVPMPYPMPT